jgi:carboxyl-terminal processing protease
MKSWALTALGALAGLVGGLAVLSMARGADDPNVQSAYTALDRFGNAFAVVRTDYVEAPDDRQLVENALNGMISDLDPHSS